jgi:hypothetical protein
VVAQRDPAVKRQDPSIELCRSMFSIRFTLFAFVAGGRLAGPA